MTRRHRFAQLRALIAPPVLLLTLAAACDSGAARSVPAASEVDSAGLKREFNASVSGDISPGGQNYSYRGLYAGMTREHLESSVRDTAQHCAAVAKPPSLQCHYALTVEPDSATLTLDVTYVAAGGDSIAYEVDAIRPLPLDVDGVALARTLADAFERQTRFLDKRDATFDARRAHVRMGAMAGERENYVDMVVELKGGRQVLTVILRRSASAHAARGMRKGSA